MVTTATRLLSLQDFAALQELPENQDRILELIDGEVEEKMGSFEPSRIAMKIGIKIGIYLEIHDIGYLTGEAGGYVMGPKNVFNPDLGFVLKERIMSMPSREMPIPPDLAIEVKSPTDRLTTLRKKIIRYLESGTRIVWVIYPNKQMVDIYRVGQKDAQNIGMDGTLSGEEVLPGFALPVADLFKM